MKKSLRSALLICMMLLVCSVLFAACDEANVPETEDHIHAFGEWVTTKEATCAARGKQERACACGEKETKSVERIAHVEVTDAAVAPTCIDTGLTEGKHCSRCEATLVPQTVVDARGHTIVNRTCIACTNYKIDFTDVSIYESDYAYDHLGTLENGAEMQTYYRRLDAEAKAFHTDTSRNATASSQSDADPMMLNAVSYKDLGITYAEAKLALRALGSDRPLYYWLANSCSYSSSRSSIKMHVVREYGNGEARARFNSLVYSAVEECYTVAEDEQSAYYIALAYHDLIIDAIDYAYESDGTTPQNDRWAHSIIGVFTDTGAVCEGYAKAFQLLLNASGVDNVYVCGDAGGRHAWNLVCLDDGEWYWFDLTWDDSKNWFREMKYNYFAITDTTVVEWKDAHLGSSTPQMGSATFLDNHTPDDADYQYYIYPLPARSTAPFASDDIIELRETFTVDGNTYALVGYNKVQLIKTKTSGTLTVADTVLYGGRTYEIVAIGAMDANGYFIKGDVFVSNSLTSIIISGNVLNVDMYAFGECFSLETLRILHGTESIDHAAFFNCTDLKEITLPKSLTFIGSQAFAYCYDLEIVIFEGSVAEWEAIEKHSKWNQGCSMLTVYCTDGTIVV